MPVGKDKIGRKLVTKIYNIIFKVGKKGNGD